MYDFVTRDAQPQKTQGRAQYLHLLCSVMVFDWIFVFTTITTIFTSLFLLDRASLNLMSKDILNI